MTIDSWRSGGDPDGWKVKSQPKSKRCIMVEVDLGDGGGPELIDLALDDILGKPDGKPAPPETVTPAPRLSSDVDALIELTRGDEPSKQKCRVCNCVMAFYLMGDISGQYFDSGLWDADGLWYESANWSSSCKEEYLNWKEVNNLTLKLEEKAREGALDDTKVFVLTDNSVYEGTFYKGHAHS